jgi:hypothetical protein
MSPLSIDNMVKTNSHLSAVFTMWNLALKMSLKRWDHGRADFKFFSGHTMVIFRIVAGICQHSIKVNLVIGLRNDGFKLEIVRRWTWSYNRAGNEMRLSMADERNLWPPRIFVPLEMLLYSILIMSRNVSSFEARGVDNSFWLVANKAQILGSIEDGLLK